ncbi:lipopolysaccharide biosynthesis protein [Streptomyces sp. CC224B]|uniref:YveK family protein n=1 Tax=Streptomyces sp. CC224B TaxID=3044571 RepID=UPI0024A9F276|nr:lipopolysaccharide biosynthesis protein [Streptomyces sp. CC224B]
MSDSPRARERLVRVRERLVHVRDRLTRLPRWWPLPACTLLGALAGCGYGVLHTPEYTATSYVIAVPQERTDPTTALGFAQAYGRVATQLAVLGDAQVEAGLSPARLRESVRVATSPDAPMIAVTASSARPAEAATTANAVARALTVSANHTKKSTQVKLLPFSRALPPSAPSSVSAPVSALVGTSAGGLLGGLVLLVRPRRGERAPAAAVPAPAPEAGGEAAPKAPRDAADEPVAVCARRFPGGAR